MLKRSLILGILILLSICSRSQEKITLTNIWTDFTFYTKSVPGFNFKNDGQHYTRLEDNAINEYDLITGELSNVILKGDDLKGMSNFIGHISSYEFNSDESIVLIKSETESIYRRSTQARFHVYDLEKKTVNNIYDIGKIMYATFSPDSKKVAFVSFTY
jgi:dipeptidyl-peptidase-4